MQKDVRGHTIVGAKCTSAERRNRSISREEEHKEIYGRSLRATETHALMGMREKIEDREISEG
jgi:hypothetical protein